MNTNTGQIYSGTFEIDEAKKRGEPLVEVSPRVAKLMRGALKREDRNKKFRAARRRRQMQQSSRKSNR